MGTEAEVVNNVSWTVSDPEFGGYEHVLLSLSSAFG